MERISFYDQIARNKRKSIVLMFFIFLIFVLLGFLISLAFSKEYFFVVMAVAIVFSLSYIMFTYYYSDKIALMSVRAFPASRTQHKQYYDIVEGLCLASGLPMPKLYIMKSPQINAFATGRNPENAVVCVTTGALEKLNKQELEGVLAHELGHIANYDIRFMTLAVVMVGIISIVSEIFLRSLWLGGSESEKKNVLLLLLGILFAILAPLFAMLVQLAISRKREFTADATAVKFTRSPTGLINALKKIKHDVPMHVNKAVAPLFMSDPFRKISGLFSTHPPIDERIKVLSRM